MDNRIPSRWTISEIARSKFISNRYIYHKIGCSRSLLSKTYCIKVHGTKFEGHVITKSLSLYRQIAKILKVKLTDILIDMDKFEIKGWSNLPDYPTDTSFLCINRANVEKFCKADDRSVLWAIKKAGISYNEYNAMSYVYIRKDGRVSAVKAPDPKDIRGLAGVLKCPTKMLYVDISKINVYENRKR